MADYHIVVVPDVLREIASAVRGAAEKYDHVFTSGGVGPTHDDMTFEGVAQAFGRDLVLDSTLSQLVQKYFSQRHGGDIEPDSVYMKLAKGIIRVNTVDYWSVCWSTGPTSQGNFYTQIPAGSNLLWGEHSSGTRSLYPVVQCENVVILPGVPSLFEKAFASVQDLVLGKPTGEGFVSRQIFLSSDEFSVANILTEEAQLAKDHNVNIGSYPSFTNSYYRVKIAMDGSDEANVISAHDRLKTKLDGHIAVNYDPCPEVDSVAKFDSFLQLLDKNDPDFAKLVREADAMIGEAFEKYGPDSLVVSFNGGKDCTCIVHLAHLSLQRHLQRAAEQTLSVFYVRPPNSFPDVEKFVMETIDRKKSIFDAIFVPTLAVASRALYCATQEVAPPRSAHPPPPAHNSYQLHAHTYTDRIRQSVLQLASDQPQSAAVIMGGRRSDPGHQHLAPSQMCDPGWPPLMRIHPILAWDYGHVWKFLRGLSLPYCRVCFGVGGCGFMFYDAI